MSRKTKQDDALVIGLGLVAILGTWAACAWTWMLLVGIGHDNWWHLMPAMGFRTSLLMTGCMMILSFISAFIQAFFKELRD